MKFLPLELLADYENFNQLDETKNKHEETSTLPEQRNIMRDRKMLNNDTYRDFLGDVCSGRKPLRRLTKITTTCIITQIT